MRVTITNPTDRTIPTEVVRNGLWAGWSYIGYEATETDIAEMEASGAIVERDDGL